ncbi:MAG: ATP-binding protein, partial [Bacteroidota bacterium]
ASSWANTLNSLLRNPGGLASDAPALHQFLNENAGIRTLFITDSLLTSVETLQPEGAPARYSSSVLLAALRMHPEQMNRLFRLQSAGYRKLTPLSVSDSAHSSSLALTFATGGDQRGRKIVGLVVDAERFILEVLAQKLDEAAGDEFLLAVTRKDSDQLVYATGSIQSSEARQTKELWLFPDYIVGIRLKGQTIDELVRERFYRNLVLIGLLDVVLIAGVWLVYRTVRREVELAQLKSDFVSNVSHELKTPLSLIRMFGETLQMKRVPTEEKQREYFDTIVQESERLTRLVNNIFNFSRIEAGKKEYHLVESDLNAVVLDVLKSYETHLAHVGFTVSSELVEGLPPITADTESISEALLNIIDNAVKYSDKEKSIGISTGMVDGMAYVDVKDHGIGIDPYHQKKIFEKFYRVSTGLVHNTKGSGLGLTLVKHIMDAHGGTVSVKSEIGKGSTFRLAFPITNDSNKTYSASD